MARRRLAAALVPGACSREKIDNEKTTRAISSVGDPACPRADPSGKPSYQKRKQAFALQENRLPVQCISGNLVADDNTLQKLIEQGNVPVRSPGIQGGGYLLTVLEEYLLLDTF